MSLDIPYPGPDVNIGGLALALNWTEASLAIIVVALRFYTQVKVVGRIHFDDWFMLLALVVALTNTSLITAGIHWGIGRHFYYLTDRQRLMATKFEFIAQPPGVMAPAIARSAFCLYILKFVGSSKWMRWTLYQVIFLQLVVCGFGTVVIIVAQCQHFNHLWDPTAAGTCWSPQIQVKEGYIVGAINSIHDLILTFLPMVIMKNLKMALRIKIVLCVLMGMSIFGFIASIIKTITLGKLGERNDFTYPTTYFIIWFTIENYICIIASSIPTIRPLFVYFSKKNGSQDQSYNLNAYGSRATRGYVAHADETSKTAYRSQAFASNAQKTSNLADNSSEEFILGTINPKAAGITKTVDVQVKYANTATDFDIERNSMPNSFKGDSETHR